MNIKGFSLIEVLVVVALIGILASFAIPAYQSTMQDSRRTDGKTALLALQMEMEKFRGNCALFPTALHTGDDCATRKIEYGSSSAENYYTLTIVAADSTGNAFTIQADPTNQQAGDTDCDPMVITVDNTNPKGARTPADCW